MHKIKNRRALQNRILDWFDGKQRDLPWLKQGRPYQIWVSEIMLQQTQISTVLKYYQPFVARFPNVRKLAAANLDDVLKMWEGLGYYRRARQLHQCSQVIVEKHNGRFPTDVSEVIKLPGIGRYTAAAILSISMGQPQPILEGNTIRLFARLMALKEDTCKTATQKTLWEFSQWLLSQQRPGDFNQALMDLGREICKPKNPRCDCCPVASHCPAFVQSLQHEIPVKGNKIQYQDLHEAILLIKRKGRYLMRKCQPGERWAGLWDFPRTSCQSGNGHQSICDNIKQSTGLEIQIEPLNKTIKHGVTKYRIQLDCYQATSVAGRLKSGFFKWQTENEINQLPLSSTGRLFASQFLNKSRS